METKLTLDARRLNIACKSPNRKQKKVLEAHLGVTDFGKGWLVKLAKRNIKVSEDFFTTLCDLRNK